ncbi:MAG: IgGFc-binding protein, partial [Deltaproteobacteria bacterium]|nr:IgGFc-binding protein [Deltaproteobacteria bacterium]
MLSWQCSPSPNANATLNGEWLPDAETGVDTKINPKDADVDPASDATGTGEPDASDAVDAADDAGEDTYDGPACTTGSACKSYPGKTLCAVAIKQCVECLTEFNCKAGEDCVQFQCKSTTCTPGTTSCDGEFLATCKPDGTVATSKCPDSEPSCVGGTCKKCVPGTTYCAPAAAGGKSMEVLKCTADGNSASTLETCSGAASCINKKCAVCAPGTKTCNGDKAMACSTDGSALDLVEDCAAKGLTCLGGLCVNPCEGDIKSNTYVGCDFWAVDLDNAIDASGGQVYDAQHKQFAVVVSNSAPAPATVTASFGEKGSASYKSSSWTVASKGLQVIKLPDPSWKIPTQDQDGTNINNKVFRIQANQPIVAYQFNPLENYQVFSNDASLLLPTNSLGKQYYVLSRRQLGTLFRSYLTVVATMPGDTTVAVKVTAKTLAGPGVPALNAGQVGSYKLAQGQVLNIETNQEGADLTGSYVESDKPIVVFGGSEASNSPDTGNCIPKAGSSLKYCAGSSNSGFGQSCSSDAGCQSSCCADHLEEQMFPVNTLGMTYVGSRLQPRGKEKDSWRVLAVQDNTTFQITPSIGIAAPTLNKGAWMEFATDKDFVLTATKPVLLGQYMASSYATMPYEQASCTSAAQCLSKWGVNAKCESAGISVC